MSSAAPLAGLKVVDLTRHLPGPLCARLLVDLGARVIKIEEPRLGDPVRLTPPLVDGTGALAALLLSGLESVALDLKKADAREVLMGLLADADVLLESFRPGTLARLGLPPEDLRERFPKLVLASISGWGQDGPYAARAGHDLTYQALAGTLSTGQMPAVPAADLVGAWSALSAVLAALVARERTGQGTWIDAALYDAGVHANVVGWAFARGGPASGGGLLSGALPCYQLYRTRDGAQLAFAPLEEHFFRRFLEAAGAPELAPLQYRQDAEAQRTLGALIARHTLAEWQTRLVGLDLPIEPVLDAAAAAAHPQAQARGLLRTARDGLYRLAFPARFDGQRPSVAERVPDIGGDTRRHLVALGGRFIALGPFARRKAGIGRRASLERWVKRVLLRRR
ncbi:MAG: CaiB/BaiF CoA-transferase family protein [Thermoanaerobaculia bacterium]|nr:CaiB/BaiF CoA-transferase family protein [Thermoanaerobaculia bacterium]